MHLDPLQLWILREVLVLCRLRQGCGVERLPKDGRYRSVVVLCQPCTRLDGEKVWVIDSLLFCENLCDHEDAMGVYLPHHDFQLVRCSGLNVGTKPCRCYYVDRLPGELSVRVKEVRWEDKQEMLDRIWEGFSDTLP